MFTNIKNFVCKIANDFVNFVVGIVKTVKNAVVTTAKTVVEPTAEVEDSQELEELKSANVLTSGAASTFLAYSVILSPFWFVPFALTVWANSMINFRIIRNMKGKYNARISTV
jgi:hypothetical protein